MRTQKTHDSLNTNKYMRLALIILLLNPILGNCTDDSYYKEPALGVTWRKLDLQYSDYENKKIGISGWMRIEGNEGRPLLMVYETEEAFRVNDISKALEVIGFQEWCEKAAVPIGFRGLFNGHFARLTGIFSLEESRSTIGVLSRLDMVSIETALPNQAYAPGIERSGVEWLPDTFLKEKEVEDQATPGNTR